MAIFKPKNYSTIVAPLAKMATTLKTYISTQMAAIESLKQSRQEIDHQISFSKEEIAKSSATAKKHW